MTTRELHFGLNVLSDGMHPAAWQHPSADPHWFTDPAYWINLARISERGTLDALFLADSPSLFQPPGEPLVAPPLALDPIVLLSTLASVTTHLGLIGTVSTSFEEPYNLARRFASLDHLSRGRVAWNVVTSSDPYAWNNFGRAGSTSAQPPRDQRYRRAAEFVDIVRALWDSWDDDAMLADKRTGAFSRIGSINTIDHRGEFFSVDGPLTLPRSPQGHPVLFQAGGSAGGLDLAARYADGVFAAQASLPDALRNAEELRTRSVAYGRPRDAIRIMPGFPSCWAVPRRKHTGATVSSTSWPGSAGWRTWLVSSAWMRPSWNGTSRCRSGWSTAPRRPSAPRGPAISW